MVTHYVIIKLLSSECKGKGRQEWEEGRKREQKGEAGGRQEVRPSRTRSGTLGRIHWRRATL